MYARVMVSITEKCLSFSGFIAAAKPWLSDYPWRAKGLEMGDNLKGLFGYKSFVKPSPHSEEIDRLILKESLAKMSLSSETAPVPSPRPNQKIS